jgi:micrococcal nuclease
MIFNAGCMSAEENVSVRWVSDGDTVILEDDRHIRYLGINAPEVTHEGRRVEPLGDAAKKYNQQLVLNQSVRLEFDKERFDHYGRTLAYLYVKDGRLVNEELVAKGYAYCLPFREPRKYDDRLLKAQRKALAAGNGIWNHLNEDQRAHYIGNKRSLRFHHHTCKAARKISSKNRIKLDTMRDAFWKGFAPAKKCVKLFP